MCCAIVDESKSIVSKKAAEKAVFLFVLSKRRRSMNMDIDTMKRDVAFRTNMGCGVCEKRFLGACGNDMRCGYCVLAYHYNKEEEEVQHGSNTTNPVRDCGQG